MLKGTRRTDGREGIRMKGAKKEDFVVSAVYDKKGRDVGKGKSKSSDENDVRWSMRQACQTLSVCCLVQNMQH